MGKHFTDGHFMQYGSNIVAMVRNIILVYIVYNICRLAFLLENYATFAGGLTAGGLWEIWMGGQRFDTSAILYTNALYIVMMLLPLHWKERRIYHNAARWIFVFCNAACVVMNLADCVYFQYTGRRTTATVFTEFENENNLAGIFGIELLRHWYLVLVGVILIYCLWKLFAFPCNMMKNRCMQSAGRPLLKYYILHVVALAIAVPLCIAGMRGGMTRATRPITISNANQYVNRPLEAAIVLNTPFSIIRTYGKQVFVVPGYYHSPEELARVYSPLHNVGAGTDKPEQPVATGDTVGDASLRKNVVILIVESFGREYIGAYNDWLENGKYKGYTPFVDSLVRHGLTFRYSYCNGRKSIDGMPSILSSIPMFVEPFFLTPASMNDVSGLAKELKHSGYYSAFFHGAENGSMGFYAFARATGFDDYFGRTEYNADKRTGGDRDFDGSWAIWDEPFLQFYANKMSEMREPFLTAVFTASSHHPYAVPEGWEQTYNYGRLCSEDKTAIHKCIRYTDNAIREFFNTASRQPWFKNTIFVITSDHTNLSNHAYYQTDLGSFCSPIIFYTPDGSLSGMRDCIAQQIDIMPTVLSALGYKRPYVGFGIDLLTTADADTWAINYQNGIYQYVKGDYLLQWDGEKTKAVYRFKTDLLLEHNILNEGVKTKSEKSEPADAETISLMECEVKAIIQSYMTRMTENQLIIK